MQDPNTTPLNGDRIAVMDMGRAAYEAHVEYCREAGGFLARAVEHAQPWEKMPRAAQCAWQAAAKAAFDHFIELTEGLRIVEDPKTPTPFGKSG